jgi:hypothetical protein
MPTNTQLWRCPDCGNECKMVVPAVEVTCHNKHLRGGKAMLLVSGILPEKRNPRKR